MQHVFHDRDDGLSHCKVCNGAEGSLPVECPGTKMTAWQEEAVYKGRLQFSNGQWWVPASALELAREPLGDVMSHHGDFVKACAAMPDGPDQGENYWKHQVHALNRMRAEAEAVLACIGDGKSGDAGCTFHEPSERLLFERNAYDYYLRVRERRAAHGNRVYMDDGKEPTPREIVFARETNGEYVAVSYQSAWAGWKMARGGGV